MDLSKPLDEMKEAADGTAAASIAAGLDSSSVGVETTDSPLFEEFYDDWASFDAAVARATAAHHPIRKRSSLTFEVYNRTVSKGRHDRQNIAEFLSKTFKCTHGIKFRARGNGKRLRHKLRDIGCPFHVYASAVEFGATYRVKVRVHEQHNHPIGPDSMKAMSGALHESDYELAVENDGQTQVEEVLQRSASTAETNVHGVDHVVSSEGNETATAAAAYVRQLQAEAEAQVQAQAQAHAEAQIHAQTTAEAHSQAYRYAQAQALLKAQAQAQVQAHAQALLHSQQQQEHTQTQTQMVETDMLGASGHDHETLLDGSMDSTMEDDVFPTSAVASTSTSDVAVVASISSLQVPSEHTAAPPAKFEETMTLESLRKRIADFAEERDWNQFHTPRNLLLALTGEVGELCEIFQWKGECKTVADWSARDKEHLGEELSDVLIYLVRLADKCDVDLPAALNDKITKNGIKYPADLVRGSSKKYNEYKRMRLDKESSL